MRLGRRAARPRSTRLLLACVVSALVACAAAAANAAAAPQPRFGPLNPAFVQYRHDLLVARAHGLRAAPAGYARRGLLPGPADLSVARRTPLHLAQVAYPATYDLRSLGRLTPIRDQGAFNSCWAFATFGSLESTLLPAQMPDFSEDNLAVRAGSEFDYGPNGGGNESMSSAYLAAWQGPVYEVDDAYGDGVTPPGLLPRMHVQDILYVPDRTGPTDNDTIKWAVTNYGAVYTSMYWADPYYGLSTDATGTHATYYYDGTAEANHAVAIVGWNDMYPGSSFASTPPGNGAFLVRNSWGSSFGDGGYFYISYYDSRIGIENSVFTAEPTTDYSGIYQYDPLGFCDHLGYGTTTAWMADAFTARGSETLEAVSFYAQVPDTAYEIYYGQSLTDRSLLAADTLAVAGYHTVALPAPPVLSSGQQFFVIVKVTTPNLTYPIAVADGVQGYSQTHFVAKAGESFASADGASWSDLGAPVSPNPAVACLKAFTVPTVADTVAPKTIVKGVPSGWARSSVRVTFTATDNVGGSGVGLIEHSLDHDPYIQGSFVVVNSDGTHTITYRAVDLAGNPEAFRKAIVRIDTQRPTSKAPFAATARHGASAVLKYQVNDRSPNGSLASVTLKVRTLSGRVAGTFSLPVRVSVNVLHSYLFHCTLSRGTYRFYVYARDLAGNWQSSVGYNRLIVE
jgi:C1A family cysteine protease